MAQPKRVTPRVEQENPKGPSSESALKSKRGETSLATDGSDPHEAPQDVARGIVPGTLTENLKRLGWKMMPRATHRK